MRAPRPATWLGAAAILACGQLLLAWPGVAPYDAVTQYAQALSGRFDDWHPPLMARLWQALLPLGGGAAPLLAVQTALYWLGLGLLAAALGERRPAQGAGVLLLGALPLFAGWEMVVVKDALMAAALVAATGLVGWWRLRGKPVPALGRGAIALLIVAATLLRANALFATLPLALLMWRASWRRRALVGLIAGVVVIVALPVVNQRLLGAEPTNVWRTLPIYDLGAMAAGGAAVLSPGEAGTLKPACASAYFWDPLGDPRYCGAFARRLEALPPRVLVGRWLMGALAHPLLYARHRLAHWQLSERLWIGTGLFGAAPPAHSEANKLGLSSPGRGAATWQRLAAGQAESPLGWPGLWTALAAALFIAGARRPPAPRRHLALAMAGSPVALEASFLVVSIAADLRYHLWPMLAAGLAALLLWPDLANRSRWAVALALLPVVLIGATARLLLPPAPASYQALLAHAVHFSR